MKQYFDNHGMLVANISFDDLFLKLDDGLRDEVMDEVMSKMKSASAVSDVAKVFYALMYSVEAGFSEHAVLNSAWSNKNRMNEIL